MKMQVPLAKPQPWMMPVTVVCLALGALIAMMLRAAIGGEAIIDPNQMSREQLAVLYAQTTRENSLQQNELVKLRSQLNDMFDTAARETELQREINTLRVRAGVTAVEGPGIVITEDDTNIIKPGITDISMEARMIHDLDLILLVNELRNAGAEAIDINGQRIASNTSIRCVGSVINVNNRPVSTPFVIRAIGKVDTLALEAREKAGK